MIPIVAFSLEFLELIVWERGCVMGTLANLRTPSQSRCLEALLPCRGWCWELLCSPWFQPRLLEELLSPLQDAVIWTT